MSKKVEFLKPNLEAKLKETQSLSDILKDEKEKFVLSDKKIKDLEDKLAKFESVVTERNLFAIKNKDLEDENVQKQNEIDQLREASEKAKQEVFQKSASSLAEELENANQEKNKEKEKLKIRLASLKEMINVNKCVLTSNLFKLKEKEDTDRGTCRNPNCKKVCIVNHFKHNWKKSVSSEIFKKLGREENGEVSDIEDLVQTGEVSRISSD